jgi:hypothetical protein
MQTHDIAKTLMKWAFLRSRKNHAAVDAMQKMSRHPQARVAANQDAVSFPLMPKIFSTDPLPEALRRP